jgi:signal transduction histidine kinase
LDLHDLMAEICAMSGDLYPDHPLRCRVPPGPLFVRADRSRLVQVLQNLIDNAAKYSPSGSPIDITIEELPGQVLISVRDYGQGISAEDLPHVFERFFKSRRQQAVVPGLGLGLYISRELVARHGGRLTATSQEGQGSTFRLELPRLPSGLPI